MRMIFLLLSRFVDIFLSSHVLPFQRSCKLLFNDDQRKKKKNEIKTANCRPSAFFLFSSPYFHWEWAPEQRRYKCRISCARMWVRVNFFPFSTRFYSLVSSYRFFLSIRASESHAIGNINISVPTLISLLHLSPFIGVIRWEYQRLTEEWCESGMMKLCCFHIFICFRVSFLCRPHFLSFFVHLPIVTAATAVESMSYCQFFFRIKFVRLQIFSFLFDFSFGGLFPSVGICRTFSWIFCAEKLRTNIYSLNITVNII